MKVMNDHRSKFSNLSSWKEKPEKNQGFNGIRTHDLRDTGAMLYLFFFFFFFFFRLYCDDHSSLSSKTAVQI